MKETTRGASRNRRGLVSARRLLGRSPEVQRGAALVEVLVVMLVLVLGASAAARWLAAGTSSALECVVERLEQIVSSEHGSVGSCERRRTAARAATEPGAAGHELHGGSGTSRLAGGSANDTLSATTQARGRDKEHDDRCFRAGQNWKDLQNKYHALDSMVTRGSERKSTMEQRREELREEIAKSHIPGVLEPPERDRDEHRRAPPGNRSPRQTRQPKARRGYGQFSKDAFIEGAQEVIEDDNVEKLEQELAAIDKWLADLKTAHERVGGAREAFYHAMDQFAQDGCKVIHRQFPELESPR